MSEVPAVDTERSGGREPPPEPIPCAGRAGAGDAMHGNDAVDWTSLDPDDVYRELSHPADLFLEVRGDSFPALCEHALFALFHNLAELDHVRPVRSRLIEVVADDPADVLRRLLAEALVIFYTEHFLAVAAWAETQPAGAPRHPSGTTDSHDGLRLCVQLYGETIDPARHELLTEVKAVTRHQLSARPGTDGRWHATILFDV